MELKRDIKTKDQWNWNVEPAYYDRLIDIKLYSDKRLFLIHYLEVYIIENKTVINKVFVKFMEQVSKILKIKYFEPLLLINASKNNAYITCECKMITIDSNPKEKDWSLCIVL